MTALAVPEGVLDRIREAVGDRGWTTDPAEIEPHVVEPRGLWHGRTALLVRPSTTEQVARVVGLCHEAGVPIVPQGGNTSLCGAAVPSEDGSEIVLCLSRMDRVRDVDALDYTITVEAGCILQHVQEVAAEHDRLFPLSLGAEGTCQIGGNLSTNAGGINTLRYGNARDLVLGLEVVLPDGTVWNGLRLLRKDNTGYDLKHLFIGGEGTLGIITAATLKLFPRPREEVTAMAAVRDPAAAIDLLARMRGATGDQIVAFEFMARFGIDLAIRHVPGVRDPFAERHDFYILARAASGRADGSLRAIIEEALAEGFEAGLVHDAVLAESETQVRELWRIREAIVEGQIPEGGSIKHDVSVPVSRVPEFLARADRAVQETMPGARPCAFGHAGDGNIHYNVTQPEGMDKAAYLARWHELNEVIHAIVADLNGSISAEHGIGRLKRDELTHYKSAVELDLMRRIKNAIDPEGLMNPGKVVPPG